MSIEGAVLKRQREQTFPAEIEPFRGLLSVEEFVYAVNISLRYHYVYLETPKTGCATIKHTLMNAELGARTDYPYFRDIHLRDYSPLLTPRQVGPFGDFMRRKPFTFCFVRDPYDRLLSAYLDKIARTGPYRSERLEALGLPADREISFAEFISALERQDPATYDAHWRPQVIQTCSDTFEHHFVGAFERLEEGLRTVLEKIGADFDAAYAPEVRHATRARSQIAAYYTPTLRARVHALYRLDFERFGY